MENPKSYRLYSLYYLPPIGMVGWVTFFQPAKAEQPGKAL